MNIPKPISYNRWKNPNEETNGLFDNIVFPIIRRVNTTLIAADLVTVQPMEHIPIGLHQHLPLRDPDSIEKKLNILKPITFNSWKKRRKILERWGISGMLDNIRDELQQGLEGYIWAPYIPLQLEPEFQPRLSIASRYSRRLVNNNFYGIINVTGQQPN